jgi:hypothetical protein
MSDVNSAAQENPSVRYDTRDINYRLVLCTAAILLITTNVLLVVVWLVFHDLKRLAAPPPRTANFLAIDDADRPLDARLKDIPAPRLDGLLPIEGIHKPTLPSFAPPGLSPAGAPQALPSEQQNALRTYGWIKKGEIARIPIDQAMRILLEKKLLPCRSAAASGGSPNGSDMPREPEAGLRPGGDQ